MKMNEGSPSDHEETNRTSLPEVRAKAILPAPLNLDEMTPLSPEAASVIDSELSKIIQLDPRLEEMEEKLDGEGKSPLEKKRILEDLAAGNRRSLDEGLEGIRLQGYSGKRIEEDTDRFSSNAPGESGEFNTVAPPVVRERGIGPEDETPLQGKVTETRGIIGRIPLVKKAF